MGTIDLFFNHVTETLNSPKFKECDYPVFRGHAKQSFELLPTLHRASKNSGNDIWLLENNLYNDFRALAGPRVSFKSSWEALFMMRHEGVPTRLIDWSENIGTALFFALNAKEIYKPHIWILNPYDLNGKNANEETLLNPEEDMKEYHKTYANYCNEPISDLYDLPVTIYPNRSNDRILAQRGLFTLHGINERKMEETSSDFIEKIDIPEEIINDLKRLIKYFGINTYSVYPDLKGLSEHLREIYNY